MKNGAHEATEATARNRGLARRLRVPEDTANLAQVKHE
jgi:hypothetical protein